MNKTQAQVIANAILDHATKRVNASNDIEWTHESSIVSNLAEELRAAGFFANISVTAQTVTVENL